MNDVLIAHPNTFEDAESSLDDDSRAGQPQTTRKLQLFRAGSLLLGIFEDEIATIAEWRQPTPLPHAPPAVLGVVSIQGRMLTTLDPRILIGETSGKDNSAAHGGIVALRGDEQVALAIEDQAEVVELAVKDIRQPSGPAGGVMLGTFRNAGQIVRVLDVKALFPAAIRGRERRQRRF